MAGLPRVTRDRSSRAGLVVRVVGGTGTIVVAVAFIPLKLVLAPGLWVIGTALAWIVAAIGLAGLMRRQPAAYLTPLVLPAGWYVMQSLRPQEAFR